MIWEIFVVWSLAWWALLGLSAVVIIWALETEQHPGKLATACLAVTFVALFLLGDGTSYAAWMQGNALSVLVYVVGYILAGGVWGIIKWWRHSVARLNKYEDVKKDWLHEGGVKGNKVPKELVEDFHEFLLGDDIIWSRRIKVKAELIVTDNGDETTTLTSNVSDRSINVSTESWKTFLETKRIKDLVPLKPDGDPPGDPDEVVELDYEDEDFIKTADSGTVTDKRIVDPRVYARYNKSMILCWMVYWPWNVVWYFVDDWVIGCFRKIQRLISGWLDGITERTFKDVDDDFVVKDE